jgi:C4-dicarboxylate-specific signal transduction histidine kinase
VRQVLALLQGEVNNRKVMLELNLDESIPSVRFNRVEFQQVFINLIMNSLDAMKSDSQRGCLKISTFRDVSQIVVSVRDNGHGIAPETMPQLFDAFFSTKPGGLGLGLSISQSITENAGGELRANNHPEGGAEFQIRIPIALDSYHASAP